VDISPASRWSVRNDVREDSRGSGGPQRCEPGAHCPNGCSRRKWARRRAGTSETLCVCRRDWIFPEALESQEEFARFAEEIDAPLIANLTEFGKSPPLTVDELAELGYAAALFPVTLFRVAMKAIEAAAALIAVEGSQRDLLDVMQTREELYELLDYQGFEARDRAHFGTER
jgi:hypothetical protein